MCFSATASFSAGSILIGISALAVHRLQRKAELAYALIPALFGTQQLLEGALWLTFPDKSPSLHHGLTQAYSVFSQIVWPVYTPAAVLLMETTPWRRRLVLGSMLAGGWVSAFLLWNLVHVSVVSQVLGQHIVYIFPHFHQTTATGLYLLGTCVSPVFSGWRAVRWFGLAISASLVVTFIFYFVWFTSVWCFFAAALSSIVLLHFPLRHDLGHEMR